MGHVTGSVLLADNPAANATGVVADLSSTRPIRIMAHGAGSISAGAAKVMVSPDAVVYNQLGTDITVVGQAGSQVFDPPLKYVRIDTSSDYADSGDVKYWAYC